MANSSYSLDNIVDLYSLLESFYSTIVDKELAKKEAIAVLEEVQKQHYRATYKRGKFPFKVEHKLDDHAPSNHTVVIEVDTRDNNPYDCTISCSIRDATEQETGNFNYNYNLIAVNK